MAEHTGTPPMGDDADLAELRALAGLHDPSLTWDEPPAGLWERIAAEAGVPVVEADVPSVEADAPVVEGGVADLGAARRRRSGPPWVLAAAAALVAVVVGAGVWLAGSDGPTVVASTELALLGDRGSGTAELVDEDGSLRLRVDTAGLEAPDGFVEVWVIDPEVSKLVSLGPLRPDGVYDLPDGLDPESFPIVDVSYEPLDGDPTHSGDSVLRGELEF